MISFRPVRKEMQTSLVTRSKKERQMPYGICFFIWHGQRPQELRILNRYRDDLNELAHW